jgi:HAD superfamily hydrolase (TIGR01509 family)
MLRALIFDFDGLILDTETPEYTALSEAYAEYGQRLSVKTYGRVVGANYNQDYEPVRHLQTLTGKPVDAAQFWEKVNRRRMEIIDQSALLPGVESLICQAHARGLKLGVASSSSHAWVEGHLRRFNLLPLFDVIKCSEDVEHIKPEPDLFLAAQAALGVRKDEAIIFEDSLNGVIAAGRAGIRVIVVPNAITSHMHIEGKARQPTGRLQLVRSLAEISLSDLLIEP